MPHRTPVAHCLAFGGRGQLRSRWAASGLALLCGIYLLAGLLGQLHQIVHFSPPAAWAAQTIAASDHDHDQASAIAGDMGAGPDSSLFGAHSAGDCQLFHHHASGLGMALLVSWALACAYAALREARLVAVLLRKSPALFFARAPPVAPELR